MKYTLQISIVNALVYLTVAYLSRRLGPELYGQLVYTLSVTSVLSFLFIFGRTELELREHFGAGKRPNIAPVFLSVCLLVIALACAKLLYSKFDSHFLLLAIPMGVLMIVGEYLSLFLRIKGSYTALSILGKPLNVFYLMVALAISVRGIAPRIDLAVAYPLAFVYVGLLCYATLGQASFNAAPGALVSRKSMPFWINSILFMLHVQAGALLLGHFNMMSELAEYSLALLVVSLGTMIFSAYFAVFLQGDFYARWTKVERAGIDFVVTGLLRAAILSAAIASAAVAGITLLYPHFFDLHQFPNLRKLSYLMVIVVVFRAIQSPLSMFMNVETYIFRKNIVTVLSYGVGWAVSMLFVPRHGAFGVFAGFVTAELLLCVFFLFYFIRAALAAKVSLKRAIVYAMIDDLAAGLAVARRINRRFSRTRSVVFVGYYGFGNYGDDLFVRSVVASVESGGTDIAGRAKMIFLSPVIDGVPATYFAVRSRLMGQLYRSDGIFGKAYRCWKRITVLYKADAVVYAGGSLFCDPAASRLFFEKIMTRAGIRFHAIGISVGPFSSERNAELVREHLREFSSISVRDIRSREFLTASAIICSHSPDIAYGLLLPAQMRTATGRAPRILLIPCPLFEPMKGRQRDFYRSLYVSSAQQGWQVDFCSFQPGDFSADFIDLADRAQLLEYKGDFPLFCRKLDSYDYIVTSRLHGAIISSMMGKPFYLYQHHLKATDFLDELGWPYRNKCTPQELLNDVPALFKGLQAPLDPTQLRLAAASSVNSALRHIFAD